MNDQREQLMPMSHHQAKPSGTDLVTEVADLTTGAGIFLFALAPLALPALALMAVAAVALIIPPLAIALLAAPVLLLRRWWRSRERTITAGWRRDDYQESRHASRERRARQGLVAH